MVSMSDMKHNAIVGLSSNDTIRPNSLLDTLILPDSEVEIDAKFASGYLSSGKQVTNI